MDKFLKLEEWTGNIRNDILAGIVVALALIPEAISFSTIAGVDPKVGLYASMTIPIIVAFLGGRLAMVSAATAAMALLMTTIVKDYGLEYLLAATILTGIFQIILGYIKLGNHMRFVPRAVMVGFINALAILIFQAQLIQFKGVTWIYYLMVLGGLGIIYGLPRLTTIIPSPLVAIVILTIITLTFKLDVPNVGDLGELPTFLPKFAIPSVPFNFNTLEIILPTAFALSFVGLLDSFLTANVVDDLTDTSSDKNREALGQGIANFVTGFFGGMAGCGMIGQSVINVSSGGRTRLSTLTAGIFLLCLVIVLNQWVALIPTAALVSVMIMVSISTFSWNSLRNIKFIPKSESAVMITTVFITVLTKNLALGVIVGVALSSIFFSRKIAGMTFVDSYHHKDKDELVYSVHGDIFFVSAENFLSSFNFHEHPAKITIDLTHSHLWDQSAVDAVDKVVLRFRKGGSEVNLIGLNEASADLIQRLGIHHKVDPEKEVMPVH